MALPVDIGTILAAVLAQMAGGGDTQNQQAGALVQPRPATNAPSAQQQAAANGEFAITPANLTPAATTAWATGSPGANDTNAAIGRAAVSKVLPNYTPYTPTAFGPPVAIDANAIMQNMQAVNGAQS